MTTPTPKIPTPSGGEQDLEALRAERDRLHKAFRHDHRQAEDLNDTTCRECGLDLRNPVHRRTELLTGKEG